ncbi:MAG: hypothetical protein MZV65_52280 [Chromatiales bacterium]|nr:hypothetical protein [Chromatiales bacterium]
MVNRYTSDRRIRSDDAYTPRRRGRHSDPTAAVIVYSQRVREAFKRRADRDRRHRGQSLRRIAHFDYWSEKVRRSVLLDAKADLLVFGNAERADRARSRTGWRPASRSATSPTCAAPAFVRNGTARGLDRDRLDARRHAGPLRPPIDPYASRDRPARVTAATGSGYLPADGAMRSHGGSRRPSPDRRPAGRRRARRSGRAVPAPRAERRPRAQRDPPARLRAGRGRPGAVRARLAHPAPRSPTPATPARWCSATATRDVWLNPPPIPLTTKEMDAVYELPYQRVPHPSYGDAKIPAYEMIRFSIAIQRGCFGGCTFCSITEHEGRIIQNRSEDSVIREIETIRDTRAGLHRRDLRPRRPDRQHVPHRRASRARSSRPAASRRACIPGICPNLNTDHSRADQAVPARADAARHQEGADRHRACATTSRCESPEYVKELAQHHVGGYLKIAPEASARGAAVEDDEAGHGHLLPLQGAVRQVLEGGGQGAVPDPVLHRRAPRHHRRGHAGAGAVAQAERLPRRPGAGVPAVARWRPRPPCTTRARTRCTR